MSNEKEYIEYIQKGYENMQACVSKLDTKVLIINTANTLLLAYTMKFGNWWLNSHNLSFDWPLIATVGYIGNLVMLVVALFLVLRVFCKTSKVWFPNHSLLTKENFSAMFPEWDDDKLDRKFVQNYYDSLMKNAKSIRIDQQEQCIVMGKIIHDKIENLQAAKKSLISLSVVLLLVTITPILEIFYIAL